MDDKALSWLGLHPFQIGGLSPTIYSFMVLFVYMVGLATYTWSTGKVWQDLRLANKQSDNKLRIIAKGNWRATFDRWLTMFLLFILGLLGLTAGDVNTLPTNVRRLFGLVLIVLFIGLFCNAERVTWKARSKLVDYIKTEPLTVFHTESDEEKKSK